MHVTLARLGDPARVRGSPPVRGRHRVAAGRLHRRRPQLLAATLVLVGGLSARGDGVGLAVAAAAAIGAWRLVGSLERRAQQPVTDAGLPLALDLAAAALRCGRTVPDAVDAGAPAAPRSAAALGRVSAALRNGDDPAVAWSLAGEDLALRLVARAAVRSADSGARMAGAFERAAAQLRRDAGLRAEARAQRVAILAVAPVGLCHLPAFVCIGVIPVLAGIAHAAFAGVG